MIKKVLLTLLLVTSISLFLNAAHLKGGWIQYEYIGPGAAPNTSTYRITIRQYLNCNSTSGQIDGTVNLGIFDAVTHTTIRTVIVDSVVNGSVILNKQQYDPCLNTDPTVCYLINKYQTTIDLPNNTAGYILAVQRCCRIPGIVNVSNSANTGITYSNTIPGVLNGVVVRNNNSPVFAQKDTVLICKSSPFTFDFSATDKDHDSLAYVFCPGEDGGSTLTPIPTTPSRPPFAPITYVTPTYDSSYPLGKGVTINPKTGVISGIAPAVTGDYVVAVYALEYRNGVLIGKSKKEIHIAIGDCALASAVLKPAYVNCNDLNFTFTNQSSASNITSYLWNFGDTITKANNTSTLPQPTHLYSDTGLYNLTLQVVSQKGCKDSTKAVVRVYPGFKAGFTVSSTCILNPVSFNDTSYSKYGVISSWSWNLGEPTVKTDTFSIKSPSYTYPTIGPKTVKMVVQNSNGCIDSITKVITVLDKPNLKLTFKDTSICLDDKLQLAATGAGVYNWKGVDSLNNANTATPNVFPKDTTTYYVTLFNNGCTANDSVKVKVQPKINVIAGPDTSICTPDSIKLSAIGKGVIFNWTSNTGEIIKPVQNPMVKPTADPTYYYIKTQLNKCFANDTVTIHAVPIPPIPKIFVVNDTICSGSSAVLSITPATIGVGNTYQWDSAHLIIKGANNTAYSTANNGVYNVIATNKLGCSTPSDTVKIRVLKSSIIYANSPYCNAGFALVTRVGDSIGGKYSAIPSGLVIDANTGTVDLSKSKPGTYTVTYALNGSFSSCTYTTSITIQSTTATITYSSNSFCTSQPVQSVSLTGTGSITNGNYSATPTGLSINALSGAITPGLSKSGSYTITYTYTDPVCGTNTAKTSVVIDSLLTPSIAITSTATTICTGNSVTFTASPVNGGSTPIYQWQVNGKNVAGNTSSYSSNSLNNNDSVKCILTSNLGCIATSTAVSNVIKISAGSVTPSVTIAGIDTICIGTTSTFTASANNGGSTPIYQWQLNGQNVGTNSTIYSPTTLNNNDVITCKLTSSLNCTTSPTVTSNALKIVSTTLTPSISIVGNDSICLGTAVTFTASPVNGGATPAYQWQVNGKNVGSNLNSFSTSTLNNKDVVICILTSSLSCATVASVTSNSINMYVGSVTPAITVSGNSTICLGASATFTAIPTNGGSLPDYQWQVNGKNVGTNSSTFTSSSLNNKDVVTCVLTSNLNCLTVTSASSTPLIITVNSFTPAVSILGNNSICAGTSVTFTASPVNGGSTPAYQWQVNGKNVGANLNTYTTSTLNNNDTVSCILTSNLNCTTTSTATSNTIVISVSTFTPTVTITGNNIICAGVSTTFTAASTNAGTTPSYQWQVNGKNVGSNSSTYTSSTLNDKDTVTCILTSSLACVTTSTVTSNKIGIVYSTVTPTVVVTGNNSICSGTSVTFTATPTNAGNTPNYQWQVNGNNVGINSAYFTSSSLNNNDIITCTITSKLVCSTTPTVVSLPITMNVANKPIVLPINGVTSSVYIGSTISLTDNSPSGVWSTNNNSIATVSPAGVVSGVAQGAVLVYYSVTNPCGSDTANFDVTVNPHTIFIPNLFSPNGDGHNDKFYTRGDNTFKKVELTIFSSWGGLLFSSVGAINDETVGWDGTYNGKAQPTGVYIYIIKLTSMDGSVITKKGSITLTR